MVVVTLLFMFYLSWRLSLVAFISVPAIVTISKLYGNYIRKLSKLSQVRNKTCAPCLPCVLCFFVYLVDGCSVHAFIRLFCRETKESSSYTSRAGESLIHHTR